MTRMPLALLLAALIAGCSIGARGDTTPLAKSPRGATVQLTTSQGVVSGELLAMRPDGILLLTRENEMTLVHYDAIQRGSAEDGPPAFSGARVRDGAGYEQLRRKSRFPQGLRADIEAALLRAHDQTELVVVRQ